MIAVRAGALDVVDALLVRRRRERRQRLTGRRP
jgi:hypothetical protein